jgi:predicted ATPase
VEGANVRSGIHTNVEAFSESVQEHLRTSGYSQKELADALSLHPKVLSRKLNGSGKARLTHQEIQRIITTLAGWHAITTREEALDLLELAQVGPSIFSDEDWQTPPLSTLATRRNPPIPSSDPSLSPHPLQHNLRAQITRLIGREWAVEQIRQLFGRDEVRLVTLVGSGGSGKTRLAVGVACELVSMFAQGVWFVDLTGVRDPAQVPMSIMQVLNIQSMPALPPLQSLITCLKNRQLLLVLDNFEQVIEASPILDEMLAGVPGLKVLVTSRVGLQLYGERVFNIPPLDVPGLGVALSRAELSRFAAIQLFVERVQAVLPHFALTDENAGVIAQICARLDGLPLALELAAVRVRVLPPVVLLERISQARLPVLTKGARNLPSRQQTLRNTITWSYDLLSSAEQRWFGRLGIFTGGWSLEAVEAMVQSIAADQEETVVFNSPPDMLEQLLNNSLLVRLPGADRQARFTMLETLREYAQERLIAQGEFERLRDWHACYYLREAEAAELGLRGPQQLEWQARLTTDRDNFRTAMEWLLQRARDGMRIGLCSFSGQGSSEGSRKVAGSRILSSRGVPGDGLLASELCLRLASAFRPYWEWQGYLPEARNWLGAALEVPFEQGAGETVLAARAKALSEASRLACLGNDQPRAVALAEESIALWQQLDDPIGLAGALLHRAWAAYAMSEYEIAKCACLEGLQHISTTDDAWLRAQLLFYIGTAEGFTDDYEQMRSFYSQSKEIFEQLGDSSAVADVLKDQGAMSIKEGRYAESIDLLLKSVQLCYKLNHKQYITTNICWLSTAFGMRGEPDPAQASILSAQLKGAGEGLMNTIGLTSWSDTNPMIQMVHQYIRSLVDEQSWEAAYAAGRTLTVEQAIDLARRQQESLC